MARRVSWRNEVKGNPTAAACRIDSSRADIAARESRDVDSVHGGLFYERAFSFHFVFQGERPSEQTPGMSKYWLNVALLRVLLPLVLTGCKCRVLFYQLHVSCVRLNRSKQLEDLNV